MNKKFDVKLATTQKITSNIGFIILALGLIIFLLIGFTLYLGSPLPLEMKIIYFFEILPNNIYLFFLISIFTVYLGYRLMMIKSYNHGILEVDKYKLKFIVKGKVEIIRINQIISFKRLDNSKFVIESKKYKTLKFLLENENEEDFLNNLSEEINFKD